MNIWVATMAAVAVGFLILTPAAMAVLFRPGRARGVKHAEISGAVVQRQVTELAVYHPEIVRQPRIDRHPWYLAPQFGVFGYSVCILTGAPITNNVASLGTTTRYTMAACFIIGSLLILSGAAMGMRMGRWQFRRNVADHPTYILLGDDIATPYRLGCAGVGTEAVSLGIYSSTSFGTTAGSLGGWLTGSLAVACTALGLWMARRIRAFNREDETLIAEALARMDTSNDAD